MRFPVLRHSANLKRLSALPAQRKHQTKPRLCPIGSWTAWHRLCHDFSLFQPFFSRAVDCGVEGTEAYLTEMYGLSQSNPRALFVGAMGRAENGHLNYDIDFLPALRAAASVKQGELRSESLFTAPFPSCD